MTVLLSLVLYVGVKVFTVGALGRCLRRWFPSRLEAWLAGWLALQAFLIAGVLALSAAQLLTPAAYRGLVAAAAVLAGVGAWRASRSASTPVPPPADFPVLVAGLATLMLAGLAIHAWYFYDTTDDALNFLLPRISLWFEHHSALLQLPQRYFDVSAWEWNSDLNVLGYFLATGRDQACAFGSVESWCVFVGAVAAFVRQLGASRPIAFAAALLAGSTPVIFLLAQTVKGELSALAGLLLGCTWLLQAQRPTASPASALFALAALAYAAGCKITALPLAGLLSLVAVYRLVASPGRHWPAAAAGIAVAVVFSLRHPVNLVLHGRLLDKVYNQPRGFSAEHLLENIRGVGAGLFARGLDLTLYFPLFAGTGLLAVVSVTLLASHGGRWAAFAHRWRQNVSLGQGGLLLGCFVLSAIYFAGSLPWYSWSFRYYLPWLLPLMLVPFAVAFPANRPMEGPDRHFMEAGVAVLILLHLFAVARPSELTPGPSLAAAFRQAAGADSLARKLGNRLELAEPFRQALAPAPNRDRVTVAVISSLAGVHLPLFGEDATNPVTFCADLPDLLQTCREQEIDVAVVSVQACPPGEQFAALDGAGYAPAGQAADLRFYRRTR